MTDLLAVEWVWLLVPLLTMVAPLAGAVTGWITLRRRGWKPLLAGSAVWGAFWFAVWLALPGPTTLEAANIAVWLFLAPWLLGGGLAALARRVTGGGRLVGG